MKLATMMRWHSDIVNEIDDVLIRFMRALQAHTKDKRYRCKYLGDHTWDGMFVRIQFFPDEAATEPSEVCYPVELVDNPTPEALTEFLTAKERKHESD